MEIDLYEFKDTLKKFEDKDMSLLDLEQDKAVAIIEVGKTNNKILNQKLLSKGYSKGDKVLAVIQ